MSARSLVVALLALAPQIALGQQQPIREDVEAREEWFWSRRSYPFETRPYAQMEAARVAANRLRVASGLSLSIAPAAPTLTGQWTPIGPNGLFMDDNGYFSSGPQLDAGRVVGISPPRVAGGPLLIAAASGGVWRTTALGAPWKPVTDDQCWLNMGAIISDPVNPSIIYAATGEYNAFSLGCGVLRSTDGGNSWLAFNSGIKLVNGASAIFGSLLIDSATAGTTGTTIIIGATAEGIVRSTNSGVNWTPIVPSGAGSPSSLVSTKGGTVFTGMTDFSTPTRSGVWKSSNSGLTWSQLPAFPNVDPTTIRRVELAVSPAAPNKVYAIVGNKLTLGLIGLFVWDDVAGTWTQLSAGGITTNGTGRGDFGTQSYYDLVIQVDPRNANRIYVAGVRAYRSVDGGATFTPMAMEIHCDWHALVIDPLNPDVLYAGTDGGVFVSRDAGDTWISYNNGLAIAQYYPGVSLHPSGTMAMGGAQDNGTQVFNGSLFWDGYLGGDGGYTAINYANPSIQYGEAEWITGLGPNIYRNQGRSLTARNNGIAITDRAQFLPPLVMDPITPTKLYFGTSRLYRTTNEGTLWTAISADLSKVAGSASITAIAVAPSDSNTIYVGTSDGNVQVTRNGGTTFTPVISGLPNAVVTDFAIDPAAPAHAIVTLQGYGSNSGHVFETATAGTTWTNISGTLPTVGANAVTFAAGIGYIFVGTDVGVFYTVDDGANWSTGPSGLPNVVVQDLLYQSATNTLLVATYGRGMFTYILGTPTTVLRGDVDGDGKVTAADALIVQQALISAAPATTAVYPKGDANCDGKIDAADVVLILRAAVGLSTGTACVGTIK